MTSSESVTTLLSSLQSALTSQTSHLPYLHERLGLPTSALESDLESLQEKLIATVEEQVEHRRKEVQEWVGKCEEAESSWGNYHRALGSFVKERDKGINMDDIKKETILPRRWELGRKASERVRQLYQAKLDTLKSLISKLKSQTKVLGDDFFVNDVLSEIVLKDESDLQDVTPERFTRLEKELARGKAETSNRLLTLSSALVQIDWSYAELGTSPDEFNPMSLSQDPSSSNTSSDSDPFLVSTPTPASRNTSMSSNSLILPEPSTTPSEASYLRILLSFINHLETSSPDAPEADHVRFLMTLNPPAEPTKSLLSWAANLLAALNAEKERRESHIQSLYDQLEPLWNRLGVCSDDIDGFVDHHRGSTNETLAAYEDELERMTELKRERMVEFVGAARTEVERLHEELLDADDVDDPYSYSDNDEEVLALLEERIAQLKVELREKASSGILGMVKKYFTICEEERELAASAQDQTRLLGRGRDPGRLLREEKMRKRVAKEKPRIQQDLIHALPSWEKEYGRPFLVRGERMMAILGSVMDSENHEPAANANKRKAPPGAGRAVTPGLGLRGTTPAPGARSAMTTPAVKLTGAVPGTKRMRLDSESRMNAATTGRAPLTSTRGGNSAQARSGIAPPSTSSKPGQKTLHQQQPRTVSIPVPKPGTAHHALGHGRLPTVATMAFPGSTKSFSSSISTASSSLASSTYHGGPLASSRTQPPSRNVSYANGNRHARRESFRPRPSVDSDILGMSTATVRAGTTGAGWRYGGVKEEEDDY